MSSKAKTTATQEEATPALVPKLRFPEFRGAGGWKQTPLEYCLDYQQPTPYLVADTKYSPAFKTPVLTAGKTFILGYTDEQNGIFSEGLPVIIFDDFTTATQFVDFPFKVKSSAMKILQAKNGADIKFMYETLQTLAYEVGAHERHWISIFAPMSVPVPNPAEQQKIAECLSSVDNLIAAQVRKVDALKTHKKGLMQQLFPMEGETQPHLRFPEFQNAGEWEESIVGELIVTITPPKKLQTSDYQPEGEFPIVDQSQDYICGWTNDGEAVIDKGLPVIVFGDHTCALKFIDQPFAQGADGIKILRPKRGIDIRFLFCALEADPVVQESYKRHFSILREKKLFYPDPKSGEQHRIASCLSSLDALITLETQKLEALKTHKKGLMQQLFPSPEEIEA
ncbi:restriction endonuclease subunit S [Acidithiobacillus ferridurans]|uniref:restriction endonuclease subunit S n=1 Tax=Acidithiobacillus ferridurans TaxID=1232575 RepID=UPI001C06F1A7|nr:restriction endonuclease subunit S [Acidithiobacillus ferridurans]MBU2733295.1 restriction endonuclease subunit S [Acidithiobacillus ferridurans]